MEFKEKLPIWKNEGVEPPKSKQEEGWKVGDRPPADWFNWLQNRTYRSLEELRNISSDNLGQFEESIKELESKMPETLDDLYVSESWKVPGGQAVHALQNFKADKKDVGELSDLQTTSKDNLVSAINELTNKSDLLVKGVDPTPENKNYKIGQMWFNKENGSLFILKGFDSNKLAIWSIFNSDGLIKDSDDPTGSPGNGKLLKGTMEEGYFGAVSSSDLISGDELASKVGVTQGTAQHSNTPWHKFAYKDKILFVAQKTIRNSISWDHLNSKDVVYGNKTIEIDGVKYKVRLIRGALTDPSKYNNSDKGAKGSEWNRLILPLHEERKDNSWYYKEYVEYDLQDWKTYLSDSDMALSGDGGGATWCQETSERSSADRIFRGSNGVSFSGTYASSTTLLNRGWRPVLEVVQ